MRGSLAISGGVVYLARPTRPPEIVAYDLDGARLGLDFRVPDLGAARARPNGIAADADHRVWVADSGAARVRAFTVFGAELAGFEVQSPHASLAHGERAAPIAIAVDGVEDDTRLLVGANGDSGFVLQSFRRDGTRLQTLRARGDRARPFAGLARVAWRGRFAYAAEEHGGGIQVFRDGEFHAFVSIAAPRGARARVAVSAVCALDDRRLVVALAGEDSGGVWLLDPNGRVLQTIASHGVDGGSVFEPSDVVAVAGDTDRTTRVFVVDQDGDRVQVFTLAGACYGSFADSGRGTP